MLDDIKKTLWATADKLRANMDAAELRAGSHARRHRGTWKVGAGLKQRNGRADGAELDALIRQKLGGLGYEF